MRKSLKPFNNFFFLPVQKEKNQIKSRKGLGMNHIRPILIIIHLGQMHLGIGKDDLGGNRGPNPLSIMRLLMDSFNVFGQFQDLEEVWSIAKDFVRGQQTVSHGGFNALFQASDGARVPSDQDVVEKLLSFLRVKVLHHLTGVLKGGKKKGMKQRNESKERIKEK